MYLSSFVTFPTGPIRALLMAVASSGKVLQEENAKQCRRMNKPFFTVVRLAFSE